MHINDPNFLRKDVDLLEQYGLKQKKEEGSRGSKQGSSKNDNSQNFGADLDDKRDAMSEMDHYTGHVKRNNLVQLFLDAQKVD